jgi:hypothetical protein
MDPSTHLEAGQTSELRRLRPQPRVWEPAGRPLRAGIGDGDCARAVYEMTVQ